MDAGVAAILGAVIGAGGSLTATWLSAYLARSGDLQYERQTKSILREALTDGEKWQPLNSLASLIGAPEKDTRELLIMLGARTRQTQPTMWGLRSRNPFPDMVDGRLRE